MLPFDQLKGGCESLTPLSLINYLNQGCDRGNSLYQKLWTHLDIKEKPNFRSTKYFLFQIFYSQLHTRLSWESGKKGYAKILVTEVSTSALVGPNCPQLPLEGAGGRRMVKTVRGAQNRL